MKKTIFILGCYILAMASCASPEERAAAAAAAADTTTKTATTITTTTDTSAVSTETASPAATPPAAPKAAATITATPAEISKGEQLIAKTDCIGCHNKDHKIVGPAYVDVAAKYPLTEANVDHLVDKIIAGGQGVWGEIPMSPHASLSKDDAKTMVKYILSLKK